MLLVVPAAAVHQLVADVLARDLLGRPDGFLARHLVAGTAEFASGNRTFVVLYLGLHGIVKLALVVALVRRWQPAYPVAVAVLTAVRRLRDLPRGAHGFGAASVPGRAGRRGDRAHHPRVSAAQARMLIARATTSTTRTSDTAACTIIVAFAHRVSGMTSVGLNAVTLVNDR